MLIDIYESDEGLVILGDFKDASTLQAVSDSGVSNFSLVLLSSSEPDSVMLDEYLKNIERFCDNGAMVYIFGSNSARNKRPLHKLIIKAEKSTSWTFSSIVSGTNFGEIACFYLEDIDLQGKCTTSKLTGKPLKMFNKKWVNPTKMLDAMYEKYGMEKVMEILIKSHTKRGQWILDPTSKRGSIAKIASKFGRKFVCIEDDCEDFVFAIENIKTP